MTTLSPPRPRIIYWHRELPPLDAEPVTEHRIEATSDRVPGTIAHRDALWQVCYDQLMAHAQDRLEQEVSRLGGAYAHVFEQAIDTRRDDASNEAWLHGHFDYVLYRRLPNAGRECPRSGRETSAAGQTAPHEGIVTNGVP